MGLATHLVLRFALGTSPFAFNLPLWVTLAAGGLPLVGQLALNAWRRQFGSDLLAGISIVTSVLLGEYLAGSIVVLMLAGGETLEAYALASASSVLAALARRMPSVAHQHIDGDVRDIALDAIAVGDDLVVYPHEICPVDGVVVGGRGVMDESYLTGEPFQMTKIVGSAVISGATNGEALLRIRATKRAADSRYARIMEVMRESDAKRPRLRRLGDQLGAIYTPVALAIAGVAWAISGDPRRFLAVLVVATPCPLLIAIPVSIVGAVSLCARRAMIVRNPVVLEQVSECRTAIFDKTGTLTYGEPALTSQVTAEGLDAREVLSLVAGLERYSRHPLARAIVGAAEHGGVDVPEAEEVSEPPGQGLVGVVGGRHVRIMSRTAMVGQGISGDLPDVVDGLECVVLVDHRYAATMRFRDAPRADSGALIRHLGPKHGIHRVMLVSGDRRSEVTYLAAEVGIDEIHAEQTPEQKLQIVRAETARAKTLYVGDGINDAPAMMAATVGVAIGLHSDVTSEAAGVVIMDNTLRRVDEFLHISRRMRAVALQSAVGGMTASSIGMIVAAAGGLTPVAGAVVQELIDVVAVLNALRAASPPRVLHDL